MIKLVSSVLMLRVVGIGFQMGWFMLLVRLLPLEQVGIYSAINAFWVLMRAIGPLGSDQALMRVLPDLLQNGNKPEARAWQRYTFSASIRRQLILLSVAAIVALMGWNISPLLVTTIALAALCYGVNGQQLFVLLAAGRPMLANALETLWLPLALAFLALGLKYSGHLSLENLLMAQAGLMLCFCAVAYGYVRNLLAHEGAREILSADQRKDFRRQSWALFSTVSIIQINVRMPIMLAPFFIGAAATALLEAALRFASLLGLMGFAAGQVYLPRISALCRKNDYVSMQGLLIESSWMVFAPTLMLYGVLVLLGEPLISFITRPEYAAAYLPMLLLGAGYVVNASAGPMQHVFTMSARTMLVMRTSLAEMMLSLVLIFILHEAYGAIGMSIALAAGMIFRNIVFHLALPRLLPLRAGVWSWQSVQQLLQKLHR